MMNVAGVAPGPDESATPWRPPLCTVRFRAGNLHLPALIRSRGNGPKKSDIVRSLGHKD